MVTNSNVKHKLSGSEYPDRVRQCREAVKIIAQLYQDKNVEALRDVTMEMLTAAKSDMSPVVYNRAKHCVGEDARTLATIVSLKAKDYQQVGRCMHESHISLKNDFEVSCEELDILVDLAMEVEGVYGSRMTGGGFGGCTVTLVKKSAAEALKSHLKQKYKERTGTVCDCYEAVPASGAGVMELSPGITRGNEVGAQTSSAIKCAPASSVDEKESSNNCANTTTSTPNFSSSGQSSNTHPFAYQDFMYWLIPAGVCAIAVAATIHFARKK